MTKNFIHITLISTLLFTFISCNKEINLNDEKKKIFSYDLLPKKIKHIYKNYHSADYDSIDYFVFSLDKNYNLSHYWTGMENQLLTKGFYHHFIINNKEFKLSANKGDPFVIYEKKLYYTAELNLSKKKLPKC